MSEAKLEIGVDAKKAPNALNVGVTPAAAAAPSSDSFAYLLDYDPVGAKAWYEFPLDLPGRPELQLVHAGRDNRAYTQFMIDASAKERSAGKRKTIDALNISLEQDREAFPGKVIVGWRNMLDSNGNQIPFSVKSCQLFMSRLPRWILEHLSSFAGNPRNFLPVNLPTEDDALAQAGN